MDDLFRKAAEDYPLKSGDSSWENVSKKIIEHNYETKPVATIQTSINNKYIALIFLFIGLVVGLFIYKNIGDKGKIYSSVKNEASLNPGINRHSPENVESKNNITVNNSKQNKKQDPFIYKTGKIKSDFNSNIHYAIADSEEKHVKIINEKNNIVSDTWLNQQKFSSKIKNANAEDILNDDMSTSKNIVDEKKPADESINKKNNSVKEDRNKKNYIVHARGAYIGLVAAVDFSNVKSMTNNNTGYGLGILFGYKFNRKISLETELIINKKNYSSEGRYFNMDKVKSTMPAGMHIKSLFTNSSVVEIPVKIKYDFIANNKTNAFASAGISSYIMIAEKNNYKATLNGNEEQFSGVYNKNDYSFPAVANISVGYEHIVSKSLNIRIEPFLKIPLKGMGVGNLPVTSTGLQLSITHSLN